MVHGFVVVLCFEPMIDLVEKIICSEVCGESMHLLGQFRESKFCHG